MKFSVVEAYYCDRCVRGTLVAKPEDTWHSEQTILRGLAKLEKFCTGKFCGNGLNSNTHEHWISNDLKPGLSCYVKTLKEYETTIEDTTASSTKIADLIGIVV